MLFSLLSKLVAGMLVAVLTGAIFTMTLNQTVLNSKYLEHHLAATNSYSRLSTALTDQISKQADNPQDPVNPAQVDKLKAILTPTLLQTKINSSLDQLQSYYRGTGQIPALDLTDVVTQAEAAGIQIPADSDVRKPIAFGNNDQAHALSKGFDQVRTGTIVTAVVLVVALLAVSWERHKWAALPDVLIIVGVLLGLLGAAFSVASGMAGHYTQLGTSASAFEPIARDLGASIASDLARRFGITAAILLIVGVVARIWVARRHSNVSVKTALKTGLQQPTKA